LSREGWEEHVEEDVVKDVENDNNGDCRLMLKTKLIEK